MLHAMMTAHRFAAAAALALVVGVSAAEAGSTMGPDSYEGTVPPATWNSHVAAYQGDAQAVLLLIGDGRSDLDLFVYDAAGVLVCSSATLGPRESCVWTPDRTGRFRIEVHNFGFNASGYDLRTN